MLIVLKDFPWATFCNENNNMFYDFKINPFTYDGLRHRHLKLCVKFFLLIYNTLYQYMNTKKKALPKNFFTTWLNKIDIDMATTKKNFSDQRKIRNVLGLYIFIKFLLSIGIGLFLQFIREPPKVICKM